MLINELILLIKCKSSIVENRKRKNMLLISEKTKYDETKMNNKT